MRIWRKQRKSKTHKKTLAAERKKIIEEAVAMIEDMKLEQPYFYGEKRAAIILGDVQERLEKL